METKNTSKTVIWVTVISLVARILTLVSYQMYMPVYGAKDISLNIYSYALNLPNVIFTCIGTLLTTVVIPVYSGLLAKEDTKKAKSFLDNILTVSGTLMIALVGIGMLIAPFIVGFSAYGQVPDQADYAVYATRVLMPVMFFHGLCFIFQGILQSHGKFKLVAAVSIPTSLTTMFYMIFFGKQFGVDGLLIATLVGLCAQSLILLPAVLKTGYRYKPSFNLKNPELRSCSKLIAPVLLGVSAYQINTLYNVTIASEFNVVTLMVNVQNLLVTSVLTVVYSATAVYYPRLTVHWALNNIEEFKKSLSEIISGLLFLLIPATLGFIAVRYSLFNLISRWGEVTWDDILLSGNMLALYAMGIWALGLKEVFDRAFYAQKNAKISGFVGLLIMVANVVFSLSLLKVCGVFALPLAYSLSSSLGVSVLIIFMYKKIGKLDTDLWKHIIKCTASALIMFLFVIMMQLAIQPFVNNRLLSRVLELGVPVFVGVAVYFVSVCLLKVKHGQDMLNKIKKLIIRR